MDNYEEVLHQMQAFGIELQQKNLPLKFDTPKKVTCGAKGKDWYRLYLFRPDRGGCFIVGTFGTYRHGGSSQKVDVNWSRLSDDERQRHARERKAAEERAVIARAAEVANAMADAGTLWRGAAREGVSPYLARKGLAGEACRYLPQGLVLRWPARRGSERETIVRLPPGTLVVPLVRYDLTRDEALRGLQFIRPDGQKIYQRGFEKACCSLRLGIVDANTWLIIVVEGFATGLSCRLALDFRFPVFVAFDAGNLAHVVPMLRTLYADARLLICADDDWKTRDPATKVLNNPGRTIAKAIAKQVSGCDIVWPVLSPVDRRDKDTDFDDLRMREGLEVVQRQLGGVTRLLERAYG
jgi:putative DNA primase/helicase